jgi:low affinity Fe/Cu permease
MHISDWILIISSVVEIVLLVIIIIIFQRLRRSEDLIFRLRQSQKELLDKLTFNAQIEKEIIKSFEERQRELTILDAKLSKKVQEIDHLIKQIKEFSSSPKVLKEIILKGYKRGESVESLSKRTGLSLEEVEWIIEQERL